MIRITVPALRERPDDIPLLALQIWREVERRLGSRAELSSATLAVLARYDWPGNVRELQNVLSALAVRSPRAGRIGPDRLPSHVRVRAGCRTHGQSLDAARQDFERRFVREALARAGGRRARAAADLGLTRQGLAKLLVRLGIDADSESTEA